MRAGPQMGVKSQEYDFSNPFPIQSPLHQPQLQPQLQPLPHGESSKTLSGQHHGLTLDNMVWGERSKDDFNMLAQLQKVTIEEQISLGST